MKRHKLVVGELTLARARSALDGQNAQIIYSDPPWGEGNLRYWRTHNGEPDLMPLWDPFLRVFCDVVANTVASGGHVFVEMGLRWVDQLAAEMAKRGLPETGRWTCLYGSGKVKHPNALWYSGPGTSCRPEGMSGESMTFHVLQSVAEPDAVVLDPCCGKGMTARCALKLGMRFAGVELNPKRAAITQAWMDRHDPLRA